MTTLVVGATGATGRLLVEQLLNRGEEVRVIVRSPEKLPESVLENERLNVIQASVLELSDSEMSECVEGCDAVASCLGHNLSFQGVYGHPRRLVTDAARRLCQAIKANNPQRPTRYVLMNTVGNRNRDLNEPISFTERVVVGLLRIVLPPQADNEQAANYLRTEIGQNDTAIEWCAVRPDSLTDEDEVTEYEVYPALAMSAIFGSGKTSRINVAHFMAELITDDDAWHAWKGQMPTIYNKESVEIAADESARQRVTA
jgi:NAD(P)-dependent dehydrogenase (short-subunit alcohol dehydrogenase family)